MSKTVAVTFACVLCVHNSNRRGAADTRHLPLESHQLLMLLPPLTFHPLRSTERHDFFFLGILLLLSPSSSLPVVCQSSKRLVLFGLPRFKFAFAVVMWALSTQQLHAIGSCTTQCSKALQFFLWMAGGTMTNCMWLLCGKHLHHDSSLCVIGNL